MAKIENSVGLKTNIIENGTKIVGEITSKSDLRIDGIIEGIIICEGKLVLGEHGVITGDINCSNAEIQGRIKGKVIIQNLLSLKSTANIEGDISTSKLVIEPNAIFNGTCSMGATDSAASILN